MHLIAQILVGLVALIHLYFLWLEMFAWETAGRKAFAGFPKDLFPNTKTMAANQGLYNGFLAAGLAWALFISDPAWAKSVAIFFLTCVLVAGLYGAYSISRKIFFVQGAPAILGLVAVLFL